MSSGLSAPLCPCPTTVHRPPAQHHGRLRLRLSLSELKLSPTKFRCYSISTPGGGQGDNESKSVLDAFFLGKALAEAVNERVESTLGDFLNTVGRLQAEQQKQVQEFQEDVLERAQKAKELAAREAIMAQGVIIPKPSTEIVSVDGDDTDSVVTNITSTMSANLSNSTPSGVNADQGPDDEDPVVDVIPIDD